MHEREIIHSDGAPAAVGPYSQAVRVGELLFTAGQIGLDPAAGALVEGGVGAQTRQVLANLGAVLEAGGSSLGSIIKSTIFLTSMDDYGEVNRIYGEAVGERPPARSTVAVAGLPLGALVEIECVALVEGAGR